MKTFRSAFWLLALAIPSLMGCARSDRGGSQPAAAETTASRPAAPPAGRVEDIRAAYRPLRIPDSMSAGTESAIQFEARNVGSATWPASGPLVLRFGYHWTDPEGTGSWTSVVWDDGRRANLPSDVPPEGSAVISLSVRALERPCPSCKLVIAPLLEGAQGGGWATDPATAYIATIDVR